MFKEVDNKISFPKMEENIVEFWEKNHIFEKSLEQTKGNEPFIFYDGPPFATGLPHYGHFVPGILKDIIPRYQTMKGRYVKRRWGWDCHGLPVEYEMEKELNLKTKKDIIKFGIDKFNESCRSIVLRYTSEWEKIIKRLGRWVDFKNAYRTMDLPYMESIWAVFKALWDKGLIYEGYKILPYCPRCATPLSNFEVNQGYKEVSDPAITIKFKSLEDEQTYFLAWTTTPWTLPSNLALAVGPDIEYVLILDNDSKEKYILAKSRLYSYYRNENEYQIISEFKGIELEGKRYEPLFPYFKEISENAFKVVLADYVSIEDGTGIVHTAPGFGEDDYNTGLKYNIPTVAPVDENGEFTEQVYDYKGIHVKDADKFIIERLKKERKLVKKETIKHNYPHCWRCDSPLIYKAISTWFVKIKPIKDKMIKANQKINWIPNHIKNGRFGKWLEGARDWAISRNRFWGTPLPVWKCKKCGKTLCIGSVQELEKISGQKITDIHKHFVDNITFKCNDCNGEMERIPEVLDCWFESGSMPYAQEHYPFENKKEFEKLFPADFISEGLDQTRGWFYTLTVLAAALFDSPAFKNVIVNGLVLAEDGKKMSKRLKNYPEPTYIMNKYGADALRLYLVNSAVIRAEELKFSENGVKEVVKNILLPLWNAYSFFVTYANIDKWSPPQNIDEKIKNHNFTNELDKWIISVLQHLIKDVTDATEEYKLYKSIPSMLNFIDKLTNWYIRRSRRRFWKSENDTDKHEAYLTLYYVLLTFSKLSAPIIPFISEEIYLNLSKNGKESVHLEKYPDYNPEKIDKTLEKRMALIETATRLGRSLRASSNIKIRQPLSKIYIIDAFEDEIDIINDMASIIKEELNVKEVVFDTDESKMLNLSAKPNFKKLGKILGKDIKKLQKALSKLSGSDIINIMKGQKLEVKEENFSYKISLDDIIVVREEKKGLKILNEGNITVGLDTTLNDLLIAEGNAREIINKIQNMRKDLQFNVIDRIRTTIYTSSELVSMLKEFIDYIKNETLTKELNIIELDKSKKYRDFKKWDINGNIAYIKIEKIS